MAKEAVKISRVNHFPFDFKKYLFYNLINLSVIHSVNDFKESIIDYRIWSLSQVRCALSLIY